jgi:thiol-disulfide isomerase/thioredoxin
MAVLSPWKLTWSNATWLWVYCLCLGCAWQSSSLSGQESGKERSSADSLANLPADWEIALETPCGELVFQMRREMKSSSEPQAYFVNGEESIAVEHEFADGKLRFRMPHFASQLEFIWPSELRETLSGGGLLGTWTKRRGPQEVALVAAKLRMMSERHYDSAENFLGRWEVLFSGSEDPAVGVFARFGDDEIQGTFLTTTGDYRYLHGGVVDGALLLTCFDGAHAFRFEAKLNAEGMLVGNFCSGNWYQETWSARRNETAQLPDAFSQTKIVGAERLAGLEFPDPDGRMQSLSELAGGAKVTLIEVFGTWCPNCHDAAALLKELRNEYSDRGLQVIGLAFELSGDFAKDARQVEVYRERFQVNYPILIAGQSDKTLASKEFPILDRIRSYPTTLFVAEDGSIRAVYTGFSGPATGTAHLLLKKRFRALIESMINE